jgi:hypothetical protein
MYNCICALYIDRLDSYSTVARAQAALLIEQTYGFFGVVNPTDHGVPLRVRQNQSVQTHNSDLAQKTAECQQTLAACFNRNQTDYMQRDRRWLC